MNQRIYSLIVSALLLLLSPLNAQNTTEVGLFLVQQNDNTNANGTSITVTPSLSSSTYFQPVQASSNRGDIFVNVGNGSNDRGIGTYIVSVAQNGRDNTGFGDTIGPFYATAAPVIPASGVTYISTYRIPNGVEVNIDAAAGFFPYNKWLGGYSLNATTLFSNDSIQLGTQLVFQSAGLNTLNLQGLNPDYTPENGVALATEAGNNQTTFATTKANEDGTFTIYTRNNSNGTNGSGTVQRPFTFAYFPLSAIGTDGLTALGRVNSDGTTGVSSGNFSVVKGPVGRWHLSIDNHSADTGTLLICGEGGGPNNTDNVVSYEWDPIGEYWVIESRDIVNATTTTPEDGATDDEAMFSFVFFEKRVAPTVEIRLANPGQIITNQSTFTVVADAADEDGEVVSVEFFRNGQSVGVVGSAPFELEQVNVAPGLALYTAVARDDEGRPATSKPLRVQIYSYALTTEVGHVVVEQFGPGNAAADIALSVLPGSSTPNFSLAGGNRGDFNVRFGNANDVLAGTVVASIAQNGRNNDSVGGVAVPAAEVPWEGSFFATASIDGAGAAFYYLPVNRTASGQGSSTVEVNINVGVGFFPYGLWLGGYARNSAGTNGAVNDELYSHPDIRLDHEFIGLGAGVFTLDLTGVGPGYTPDNGIVLANHAKNEGNHATVQTNPDGTFTLYVRDNAAAAAGNEQDPISFVYLPTDRIGFQGLTALGRVKGDGATPVLAGPAIVTKGPVGRWYVKIPGETVNTGTLLISAAGGEPVNRDNVVSYEWDETSQHWVIESRDLQTAAQAGTTAAAPKNPELEDLPANEDAFHFAFFKASAKKPTIRLSAPNLPPGRVVTPASFNLLADASDEDGQLVSVEFFINGVSAGVQTTEPFQLPQLALPPGSYSFTARARDNDDYVTESEPFLVTVLLPDELPGNTALWFDGVDDHVVMPVGALGVGAPPTLGFTLECWFRKEGAGMLTATSQGVTVLPLIAKGRQQTENNNTDVNYMLGLTLDGLVAFDFEAFPATGVTGGTNYPLVATHAAIATGDWHHAVATYDTVSGVMNVYLDGVLVGNRTAAAGARPRFDSNHPAAIGTAYNTLGQPLGAFPGVIDEVRIWNYSRSPEEIQNSRQLAIRAAAGLVGRFGFDEGQGKRVVSSLPDNISGTLVGGPVWTFGAPLNNDAPRVVLTHPLQNALLPAGRPVILAAAAADLDGTVALVEFFSGEVKLGEAITAPYVHEWAGGSAGSHLLSAVATDNLGAVIRSEAVQVSLQDEAVLMLTEVQSSQSATSPLGAADYWELTNFSDATINLEGYTWTNAAGDYPSAAAWAVEAGVSIAAGESILFTTMDPVDFRAWWGISPAVQVIQSVGAPDLGDDDSVRLFDGAGSLVFSFSYATGGFTLASGEPALGGSAGTSGGGDATAALVWEPTSGILSPRYAAAAPGANDAANAVTGDDVGSPGTGAVLPPALTPLVMVIDPPAFSESAANPAATGLLQRYGDISQSLMVNLTSSDTSAATVPASVSFAAGEAQVSFDVTAVNDFIVDDTQVARIMAAATGAVTVWQDILVEDDEDHPPPDLLLTEIQSQQSPDAASGATDYFEITHFGDRDLDLEGYTWDNNGTSFAAAQAWALPAGATLAPGESAVITTADPAAFRTWWGVGPNVKVFQTVGAPDLGENETVVLYTNNGVEVFSFSYAENGFTRQFGLPAVGGHAGVSAGASVDHVAAVWNPTSTFESPTYLPANAFRNGGRQAAVGTDIGSPGVTSGAPISPPLPEIAKRGPLQFELVSSLKLPSAEISAYDASSRSLFVTGSSGLQVLTIDEVSFPELQAVIDFTKPPFDLNSTDVTSVAVSNGVVAVAIPNAVKQDVGSVVFLNAANRSLLSVVTVGVLPDMICFTPDGLKVLTANEGEMLEDGTDPAPGSVSIIDVSAGFITPTVTTVGFEAFDAVAADLKEAGVRIFEEPGFPGQLKAPSLDFEPEYIAVAPDSRSAMVTLQEANAVAILDLETNTFTSVVPLGEKDFSQLLADFSDQDGEGGTSAINLTTGNPVFGLYMPDAIAAYQANGQTYYVTANEGDDRNDFSQETILLGDENYVLDPDVFPNAAELKDNARLGRLVVSNSPGLRGDIDGDGDIDRILAYGGRSISILDEAGQLVWDSGDLIERLVAEFGSPWFDDSRSTKKGAEPEGVTIGEIEGRMYAFVALERARGVMAFEVTDPTQVKVAGFVSLPTDTNPESITFIPENASPNGKALLAVTNEGSGTVTFFNVSRFTLQMLHLSNAEAGALAPETAPYLAALVEGFEPAYDNTLILAGGDNFIPGPFLTAGSDPILSGISFVGKTEFARPDIAIHNLIGVEASAVGNREWDLGSGVFANAIRPDGLWTGAQFPYLSANLDYSSDVEAFERLVDVPLDGATSAVPNAANLKGRLAPMAVVEKGGEKLGLIGVTTQLLNALSSPSGTVVKGATTNNLNLLATQVQAYINELEADGVNKIILLSHLQELALERELAEKLRGVDVVLAGGAHTRLGDDDDVAEAFPGHAADFADTYPLVTAGLDGAPVLIVSTDSEFTYLGRLVIDFDLQGQIALESLSDYVSEAGAYAATAANVATVWSIDEADLMSTAFAAGTRGEAVRQVTEAVRGVVFAKDATVYGYTSVYLEGESSLVRRQETNLGNLVADANLALSRAVVNEAAIPLVGLVNAGSISAAIGSVSGVGSTGVKMPPIANPSVGKPAGSISQLDVEAALRGNHRLMVFDTTATGLKALLEHGLIDWPNQARFLQVAGVMFAWDPARSAGDRITSISLMNDDGSAGALLYKAGALAVPTLAQAPALIRVVTTNTVANGDDGFPSKLFGQNFRYVLTNGTLGPVIANTNLNFTVAPQLPSNAVSDQGSLALYLQTRHGTAVNPFGRADTLPASDERIQNRLFRLDTVPPLSDLDSDGDGLSDLNELLLGGNPNAAMRIGDFLDLDLAKLAGDGETLRLVGKLPNGVRFDRVTGRLTGLIGGQPGLFDLQVLISDGAGGLRAVNLRLGLEAFPARLLAGYEALLENEGGLPMGIIRLNVSKPSTWTANMDFLGTGRRASKGTFILESGEQRTQIPMVFKANKTSPELRITLTLDADSPEIVGEFDNDLLAGGVSGFRLVNFGGSPPDVRRINAALDAGVQDGIAYPAGLGWLKGTVNKSGAVNLRGQLGDTRPLVVTTRLSATGQALVWAQPYPEKAASFFGGVFSMPNVGQPAAVATALESGSYWFKAANPKEKAYEAGFAGPLLVTALTSGFVPVKTAPELEALFGLTNSTLLMEIEGGGLSNALGAEPKLMEAWTLAPNFALLSTDPNAARWTGRIVKADGGVTGSLVLPVGAANLAGKAVVNGVLLPNHEVDEGVIGAGLIKVPVPGVKGAFRTSSLLITP